MYYSGFCTYEVIANNEEQAILKASKLPINKMEILSNLERWEDADEAFEINRHIDVVRKQQIAT